MNERKLLAGIRRPDRGDAWVGLAATKARNTCSSYNPWILLLFAALAGCIQGGDEMGERKQAGNPSESAVVLLASEYSGSWPTGLDPATNATARANLSIMNAIFGGLFQLSADADGSNPRIVGVLAKEYEIQDGGRKVLIRLRSNVRFSDGEPFDAAAVKLNIERNLTSPCTCAPTSWPWRKQDPVTVADTHTVELHFSQPYAAVMNVFPVSNINWIASPIALERMPEEEFRLYPVGAGPFVVVSNQLSSKLVLERNPSYWDEGRPLLDRLTFQSIGSEEAALQALVSGSAHVYEGMTSTHLIKVAQETPSLAVTQQPPTSPYMVQLNTALPPFDRKPAREAIYFATDPEAISKGLFNGWYPTTESFTAPGGLYYEPVIAGYRQYDLERARKAVDEAGGVKVTVATLKSFVAEQVLTALQTQWRKAGIDVSIETYELSSLIALLQSGKWQALLQVGGSYDPEGSGGVSFRFRSDQPYTGVKDPDLDALLLRAAGEFDETVRHEIYRRAAVHISDEAYAPFLFAFAPAHVAIRDITGPGLSTKIPPIAINTAILWQDVGFVR